MCTHFLKNVYKQWSCRGFIMSVTEIKALFITTQHSIQWKTLQIKRRVAFKNHLERGKQNAICYKKQRTIKRVEKNAKVTKSALEHGKHNTIIDNYLWLSEYWHKSLANCCALHVLFSNIAQKMVHRRKKNVWITTLAFLVWTVFVFGGKSSPLPNGFELRERVRIANTICSFWIEYNVCQLQHEFP